jgi:hypothetical protein
MPTQKLRILFFAFMLMICTNVASQATLTIKNNSERSMTVKVMVANGPKGVLHETLLIEKYGTETISFSETGKYFTKSKAILSGREPVYRKGKVFKVINDETGHSVMTLTFTIVESKMPAASGGVSISKKEFEEN